MIQYSVHPCALGFVLVAASERGLCAVSLGSDPDELVRSLQDEYPQAKPANGEIKQMADCVIRLIEDPTTPFDLPLDLRGTAFQQRVWQALREIPPGETATYSEIARRIGAPGAARAVGQACAENRLAIVIPCHRAIRSDGGLSGYRWGLDRKRALLDLEASTIRL